MITKKIYSNLNLNTEEGFMNFYGAVNCGKAVLKSGYEVLQILEKEYPKTPLTVKAKLFIIRNSGSEVLFQSNHENEFFLFGEDDIPFTRDCFI